MKNHIMLFVPISLSERRQSVPPLNTNVGVQVFLIRIVPTMDFVVLMAVTMSVYMVQPQVFIFLVMMPTWCPLTSMFPVQDLETKLLSIIEP